MNQLDFLRKLASSSDVTSVTLHSMAIGESGRIVVDVGPEVKRELYAALAHKGSSLKDWFLDSAHRFCGDESKGLSLFDYDPNKAGGKAHPTTVPKSPYSVVSMFSGCGGMDLGFRGDFTFLGKKYEKNPFEIVWANDINPAACETYLRNLKHEIHCGDVTDFMKTAPANPDVLVGGFPCQDISVNGKMKGVNGTRSGLYKHMISAIRELKPKVFVAENVKGLLMKCNKKSLDQIIRDFNTLGYTLSYSLYNSADYGVPQTRERVFIVGTSSDLQPFVRPPAVHTKESWITAKSALNDLEKKAASIEFNHIWSAAKKSAEQGSRRLRPDRPAHTIRAECHGNIQFHYKLDRRISMREAARCQSFPDNFVFSSGIRHTERQVGNAVPPVLAWHIARAVMKCLG